MLYNFGTQCPIQSPLPDHGIIRTLCDLRKWWNWWCSMKVCEPKMQGGYNGYRVKVGQNAANALF